MIKQTDVTMYEKLAKSRIVPTPDKFQVVDVTMKLSGGSIEAFAKVDYSSIVNKLLITGGQIPDFFTEEEYVRYQRTICYSRIAWVRGDYYVIHPNDDIAVPAFLSTVLMNVGRAEDVARGITLIPVSDLKHPKQGTLNDDEYCQLLHEVGFLTKDECRRVSAFIKSVPGAVYGKGYTKDRTGTFSFMSMQMIEDMIKTYTPDTHPVYALLASVFEPTFVCEALSPTVRYSDKAYVQDLYWEVTTA